MGKGGFLRLLTVSLCLVTAIQSHAPQLYQEKRYANMVGFERDEVKLQHRGCVYDPTYGQFFRQGKLPSFEFVMSQIDQAIDLWKTKSQSRDETFRFTKQMIKSGEKKYRATNFVDLSATLLASLRKEIKELETFGATSSLSSSLANGTLRFITNVTAKAMDGVGPSVSLAKTHEGIWRNLFRFTGPISSPHINLFINALFSTISILVELDTIEILQIDIPNLSTPDAYDKRAEQESVERLLTLLYTVKSWTANIGVPAALKILVGDPFKPTQFNMSKQSQTAFKSSYANGGSEAKYLYQRFSTIGTQGKCTFSPLRGRECKMEVTCAKHTTWSHFLHGVLICYRMMDEKMGTYRKEVLKTIGGFYKDHEDSLLKRMNDVENLLNDTTANAYKLVWRYLQPQTVTPSRPVSQRR